MTSTDTSEKGLESLIVAALTGAGDTRDGAVGETRPALAGYGAISMKNALANTMSTLPAQLVSRDTGESLWAVIGSPCWRTVHLPVSGRLISVRVG